MKEWLHTFLVLIGFYAIAALILSIIYLVFGERGVNALVVLLIGISLYGLTRETFIDQRRKK